jgi:hypothetical protein
MKATTLILVPVEHQQLTTAALSLSESKCIFRILLNIVFQVVSLIDLIGHT